MFREKDEIRKLASLCRIRCTETEEEELAGRLDTILSYAELLQEVDTTGVSPRTEVVEIIENILRDDVEVDQADPFRFVEQAPEKMGSMVRVPPIVHLESNEH